MLIDVDKISGYRALIYIFTVVSLIIPGIGYIYITNKSLFADIETTKLILLSIFYSFPLYILCFMGAMENLKIDPPKETHEKSKDLELMIMWGASILSTYSFYGAILVLFYISLLLNIPLFSNISWNIYLLPFVYFVGFLFSVFVVLIALGKANSQKITKSIDMAQVYISKFIEKLWEKRKTS